ncbi:proline iminopeptidase [Chelatococcus caeni]|uniref:Proline iminopeptidase n=1 Tax=Chelatococcus caeni TaxID=1348468 RepID=A0A840C333_9HYPH|nr:prolyl aminopeptidase [Chelatococcus caeni]MBB4019253.1 proline iminopeptidase [Chelatococcus caeni]
MTGLLPETTPHAAGMLDVGDGHRIYWETGGNPQGEPAVVLHGGPGSGISAGALRYFDPLRWRIVLFDQRGCGRSTPHASAPGTDLSANTTAHLVADVERLRCHLGIARWLVLGGSWGSTLALAYAARHRERVAAMVLYSIALTSAAEIDWITRGVGMFFPEAWERFCSGVPLEARDGSLVEAYHRLLVHPDPAVHGKAARDWCDWEAAILAVHPGHRPHPRWDDTAFRLGFARLVTHYWRHAGWFGEGELLAAAEGFGEIPAVLVHGRLDFGGPLVTPWRLARRWPGSELVLVGGAGHDARDPGMAEAVAAAVGKMPAA